MAAVEVVQLRHYKLVDCRVLGQLVLGGNGLIDVTPVVTGLGMTYGIVEGSNLLLLCIFFKV